VSSNANCRVGVAAIMSGGYSPFDFGEGIVALDGRFEVRDIPPGRYAVCLNGKDPLFIEVSDADLTGVDFR
jgi:hypothetical protein